MLCLKLDRSQIVKRLMKSLGIVESLDVTKNAQPCILEIGERFEIGPFVFQRPEVSFHHCVVVAASRTAHGASDPQDVKFDAFFAPDPANSTGRFASVVGGGWQMIAETDSVSLVSDNPGFTAPFDYTWSGTGSLMFAEKAK